MYTARLNDPRNAAVEVVRTLPVQEKAFESLFSVPVPKLSASEKAIKKFEDLFIKEVK